MPGRGYQPQPNQPQPNQPQPAKAPKVKKAKQGKKGGHKTTIIISIVAAAVVIAAVAGIFIYRYLKKGGQDLVFTEKEYKAALEAYMDYVEDYEDEYDDGDFAADIILDANGNPVLVTYEGEEDCNILWYDEDEVVSIAAYDTYVNVCTDGVLVTEDDDACLVFYQISGREVNKIIELPDYDDPSWEMVVYYDDEKYEYDFMDEETFTDENETLLTDFYTSIYGEDVINAVLENYSAFDLVSKYNSDWLYAYPGLSPIYQSAYEFVEHGWGYDYFEDMVGNLKNDPINTQKEFYIYKKNYASENGYNALDYLNTSIMAMRDDTWIYELDGEESKFEMDEEEYLIECVLFPGAPFGSSSLLEIACQSRNSTRSKVSTDISNADTIKTVATTILATERGYDAIVDYLDGEPGIIIVTEDGLDEAPEDFTTEFLEFTNNQIPQIENTASGAEFFTIYIDDNMYDIAVYAGYDENPTAWKITPDFDESYREAGGSENDYDVNTWNLVEYMESYADLIEIPSLLDEYGSDWEGTIEAYIEWTRSDEFADIVEESRDRLEDGEDIWEDFDGYYEEDNDYEYDDETYDDEAEAEDESSSTRMTDDGMMVVPASDGEKIYAYSWNEEFGNRIQYFRDKYPELSDLVEYVNLGMEGTSDDYKQTLLTMLQQGTSADKYPSLFAVDDSIAKYMLSSDYVMNVYDAGFTGDMLTNMYDYTIDYATIDGTLKGLTWQSTPGCFCYRSDIAEEVLGVTSPDEMQAMVSDWDDFWYVAELMKEAGYYMLSGYDDLKYVCIDQNQTPWVIDNILNVGDDGEVLYLEYAKYAYENGYTKGTSAWSDGWYNNMDDDVFCYFGCTWFLYWTLGANANNTIGDWQICIGPAAYHWGGSYIGIGIDTPNLELAALVVYTLCCDTEVMTEIFENDYDFVNNSAAIDQAITDGAGTCDLIGNQNPLEVWTEVAENVDLSAATSYDLAMNGFLDDAVAAYCSGEVSYDGAIQYIKEQVISKYPNIIVE